MFVTEHPFPEDEWMRSGGHHALDPFVALSFAAAATSTINVMTFLCVVPYRNPFLTAKAALSVHVLSGERLILGVGAGYLKPEFDALGVDFDERNELTDEAIDVIRRVGGTVSMTGRRRRGHTMLPHPRRRRSGSAGLAPSAAPSTSATVGADAVPRELGNRAARVPREHRRPEGAARLRRRLPRRPVPRRFDAVRCRSPADPAFSATTRA